MIHTHVATVYQTDLVANVDPLYPAHLLLQLSSTQVDSMAEGFSALGNVATTHDTLSEAYTELGDVLGRDIASHERGQWIAVGLLDWCPELGHGAYYARIVE